MQLEFHWENGRWCLCVSNCSWNLQLQIITGIICLWCLFLSLKLVFKYFKHQSLPFCTLFIPANVSYHAVGWSERYVSLDMVNQSCPFGKVVGNDFMVINLNSIFFFSLGVSKFRKLSSNFSIIHFLPFLRSKILPFCFISQFLHLI